MEDSRGESNVYKYIQATQDMNDGAANSMQILNVIEDPPMTIGLHQGFN